MSPLQFPNQLAWGCAAIFPISGASAGLSFSACLWAFSAFEYGARYIEMPTNGLPAEGSPGAGDPAAGAAADDAPQPAAIRLIPIRRIRFAGDGDRSDVGGNRSIRA